MYDLFTSLNKMLRFFPKKKKTKTKKSKSNNTESNKKTFYLLYAQKIENN